MGLSFVFNCIKTIKQSINMSCRVGTSLLYSNVHCLILMQLVHLTDSESNSSWGARIKNTFSEVMCTEWGLGSDTPRDELRQERKPE
jgi:hypothetical protein